MRSKLLERQIKKYLSDLSSAEKLNIDTFLLSIDEAYQGLENDRILMERSIDISYEEMLEKNKDLEEKSRENKMILSNLIESISSMEKGNSSFKGEKIEATDLSSYLRDLIKDNIANTKKILENKDTTDKLNLELMKFKLAVDDASDCISILDVDQNILYINKASQSEFGYSLEEALGHTCYSLFRKHTEIASVKSLWEEVVEGGVPLTRDLVSSRKDNSKFISQVHITPIISGDGTIIFYLLIERDITKKIEIDNMKDEFLSIASHELRTPMTIINGYNDILLSEKIGTLNEKQIQYLERIGTSIEKLISIANDMLDIGKMESGRATYKYAEFDIYAMIQRCVTESFQEPCGVKGILIEVIGQSILMDSDSKKIEQVLINLIGNAYKFTEKGGAIRVNVFLEEKNMCMVEVSDTGVGIPSASVQKLFKKFSQIDNYLQNKANGTGLGLSISKMIIEQLGGKIGFKNNPSEKGSIFYFGLPLQKKIESMGNMD